MPKIHKTLETVLSGFGLPLMIVLVVIPLILVEHFSVSLFVTW